MPNPVNSDEVESPTLGIAKSEWSRRELLLGAGTGAIGLALLDVPETLAPASRRKPEAPTTVIPNTYVAFQTNTGVLGINSNGKPSSWDDTNLGMMPGTSPRIIFYPHT